MAASLAEATEATDIPPCPEHLQCKRSHVPEQQHTSLSSIQHRIVAFVACACAWYQRCIDAGRQLHVVRVRTHVLPVTLPVALRCPTILRSSDLTSSDLVLPESDLRTRNAHDQDNSPHLKGITSPRYISNAPHSISLFRSRKTGVIGQLGRRTDVRAERGLSLSLR